MKRGVEVWRMSRGLQKRGEKLLAWRRVMRVRRLPFFLSGDLEQFAFKLPEHAFQFELLDELESGLAHFGWLSGKTGV